MSYKYAPKDKSDVHSTLPLLQSALPTGGLHVRGDPEGGPRRRLRRTAGGRPPPHGESEERLHQVSAADDQRGKLRGFQAARTPLRVPRDLDLYFLVDHTGCLIFSRTWLT